MRKVPFRLDPHFFFINKYLRIKNTLCHQFPPNVFWYLTGHLFEFLWEFRPDMLRAAHEPPLHTSLCLLTPHPLHLERSAPRATPNGSAYFSSDTQHQTNRSCRCLCNPKTLFYDKLTTLTKRCWKHDIATGPAFPKRINKRLPKSVISNPCPAVYWH